MTRANGKSAGRGYFAMGIYQPKSEVNVGTLWRTANLMGASMLFTIGARYQKQSGDTMVSHKHMPLIHFNTIDDAINAKSEDIPMVGVELIEGYTSPLHLFKHPLSAWYLLGAEDRGIPVDVLNKMERVVTIHTAKPYSLNVSVAGSIVAYDRFIKGGK